MKLKYDTFDRHFEIFLKHNPLSTSEINLLLVSMVLFPLVSKPSNKYLVYIFSPNIIKILNHK